MDDIDREMEVSGGAFLGIVIGLVFGLPVLTCVFFYVLFSV